MGWSSYLISRRTGFVSDRLGTLTISSSGDLSTGQLNARSRRRYIQRFLQKACCPSARRPYFFLFSAATFRRMTSTSMKRSLGFGGRWAFITLSASCIATTITASTLSESSTNPARCKSTTASRVHVTQFCSGTLSLSGRVVRSSRASTWALVTFLGSLPMSTAGHEEMTRVEWIHRLSRAEAPDTVWELVAGFEHHDAVAYVV
jgi:hypothetical protein